MDISEMGRLKRTMDSLGATVRGRSSPSWLLKVPTIPNTAQRPRLLSPPLPMA